MIVGVDFSTFRVDTAWVSRALPCRWHVELDGKPKRVLIDRIRAVRMQWPLDVECVAIEFPVGRSRRTDKALMAVVGAITRSVPRYATCAWPSTWEVREAIGAAHDDKPSAHFAIRNRFPARCLEGWDEHELDALVASVGWTEIHKRQEST